MVQFMINKVSIIESWFLNKSNYSEQNKPIKILSNKKNIYIYTYIYIHTYIYI